MKRESFSQGQFFDTESYSAAMDYSPDAWSSRADVQWHSNQQPTVPQQRDYELTHDETWDSENPHPEGFHTGTWRAALDRMTSGRTQSSYIHPVRHASGQYVLRQSPRNRTNSRPDLYKASRLNVWADAPANGMNPRSTGAVRSGLHVPYENQAEDEGSVSFRSPRQALHTWRQDVLEDANAPRRYRDLAQAGYDLTYQEQPYGFQPLVGHESGEAGGQGRRTVYQEPLFMESREGYLPNSWNADTGESLFHAASRVGEPVGETSWAYAEHSLQKGHRVEPADGTPRPSRTSEFLPTWQRNVTRPNRIAADLAADKAAALKAFE